VIAEMIFGEKLKSKRKNNGWSQEELAERLFVPISKNYSS